MYFSVFVKNVPVIVGSEDLLFFQLSICSRVLDSGDRLCSKAVLQFGDDLEKLS